MQIDLSSLQPDRREAALQTIALFEENAPHRRLRVTAMDTYDYSKGLLKTEDRPANVIVVSLSPYDYFTDEAYYGLQLAGTTNCSLTISFDGTNNGPLLTSRSTQAAAENHLSMQTAIDYFKRSEAATVWGENGGIFENPVLERRSWPIAKL